MKVKQGSDFQPITITLETAEEAEAVWTAIAEMSVKEQLKCSRTILSKLDVEFCNLSNGGADISKNY